MGWGDYFYYCYYYYYYYNYYLKKPHKTRPQTKRGGGTRTFLRFPRHRRQREGCGGRQTSARLAALGQTDGRTDGWTEGGAAAQRLRTAKEGTWGDACLDTHGCWRWRTQAHRLIRSHLLVGAGVRGAWGGHVGTRAARLLGREGGRGGQAQPCHLPAPFCFHAPWCGQHSALPGFTPQRGQTPAPCRQLFGFGSFLSQWVGRAGGGQGLVWTVTWS